MTRNPDTDGAALLLLTPLTVPTERNLSSISHQTLLFVRCETVPAPATNRQPPKWNGGTLIVPAYPHKAHTATETQHHQTGPAEHQKLDTANSAAIAAAPSRQHPHSLRHPSDSASQCGRRCCERIKIFGPLTCERRRNLRRLGGQTIPELPLGRLERPHTGQTNLIVRRPRPHL